jgi:photosystem II stability/assembly factor-like uncharacterized protein
MTRCNWMNSFLICMIGVGLLGTFAMPAIAQWESLDGPTGGTINRLFVGQDGTVYAGTPNSGIFVSMNDGMSWNSTAFVGGSQPEISESPSGRMFFVDNFSDDLYYSDDNFETISTITGPEGGNLETIHAFSDDILLVAGRGDGSLQFYRSENGGDSWTANFNGGFQAFFPTYVETAGGVLMGFEISVAPQFSSDNGETWTERPNPGGGLGVGVLLGTDDGNVIAGRGSDIHRSTDGGSNWTEVLSEAWLIVNKGCVAADGTLYVRTNQERFYSSSDDGQNWTAIEDNLDMSEESNVLAATSSELLLGAEHGVWASADNGTTWSASNDGLVASNPFAIIAHSSGSVAAGNGLVSGLSTMSPNGDWTYHSEMAPEVAINGDGDMFSGAPGGDLWRSTNGGSSWSQVGGLPGADNRFYLFDSPGSNLFVYGHGIVGINLFRSTDGGDTFTQLEPEGVNDLTYDQDGNLYIVTGFNGFAVSTDNGDNWTYPNLDAPLVDVEIAPNGTLYRSSSQVVQRSDDGGTNWANIHQAAISDTIQFPGFTINTIGVDGNGDVYIDMEWFSNWPVNLRGGGVYTSSDGGDTWSHSEEWRASSFNQGQDGYFYAGTSRGVYRSTSMSDAPENSYVNPVSFSLSQNYPNPFNASTSISFNLPQPGYAKLAVFDITGRRVATLLNSTMNAGSHKLSFEAEGLASGVYFYRLSHPAGERTNRMTLIK